MSTSAPDVQGPSDAAKTARLQRGARLILGRLQEGPATNVELLRFGIRYGARLFELRQRGHKISTCEDKTTGLVTYELDRT